MADIKIYGKLINATTEGKIVGANQTYDDTQEKFQSQINAEIKGQLGNSQSGLLKKVNDIEESLNSHRETTTGNPHNVTKSDVGLSNVDNTSDAEKPISTATQSALDIKANKSDLNNKISSTTITNIITLTSEEYTQLSSKDSKTLYLIVDSVIALEDGALIIQE